jgi:hypothetical protein
LGPDSRPAALHVDQSVRRPAQETPLFDLKEELESLKVAASFGYRLSPSIKPMAAEQNPVGLGIGLEGRSKLGREIGVVLRVLDDRDALKMCMRGDTGEALQQFVSLEGHVAERGPAGGDERVPDGVYMQDCACVGAGAIEDEMQTGLRGGLAFAAEDVAIRVDLEQAGRGERTFVEAAGSYKDAAIDARAVAQRDSAMDWREAVSGTIRRGSLARDRVDALENG